VDAVVRHLVYVSLAEWDYSRETRTSRRVSSERSCGKDRPLSTVAEEVGLTINATVGMNLITQWPRSGGRRRSLAVIRSMEAAGADEMKAKRYGIVVRGSHSRAFDGSR
jgi:hypothetical protein